MTVNVGIPGIDPGIGDLLSFHVVADLDGFVIFVVTIKKDDSSVTSYRTRLPVERARDYVDKAHIAVSQALMHAPRPKQ